MILLLKTWLLCYLVWLFFLDVMQFDQADDAGKITHPIVKFHVVLTMLLGVGIYAALNAVVATIVFLDPPREFEFTKRCQRYIAGEGQWFPALAGYRAAVAEWVCKHLLDPYDIRKKGKHC